MLPSAAFSALSVLSPQYHFTWIQARAYRQRSAVRGGCHSAGSWSDLDWLTLSVTAHNWGPPRSLANCWRREVVHAQAPEAQASASGTMWSMSTSEAAVQVAPSYGLYQEPEVAAQEESVTTLVPSRLSTSSRVLQEPLI